jgi:replication factor C subunit 3/5
MIYPTTMYNLPWIEKYRPNNLGEMIDHSEKIETLRSLISKREMPHLLFYGPPGCGKTSMILACAQEMYGQQYKKYILELNASDDRGIETVRTKIPNFIKTASNKIKLVILDEADAMTIDAQSALRRVIEKHSKTSRFCLICNNINKIIPGLHSRCTKMRFGYLSPIEIRDKITDIVAKENIKIGNPAINRLISLNRDFRQILNTLQCVHSVHQGKEIFSDDINAYLCIPTNKHVSELINIMMNTPLFEACNKVFDLFKTHQWNGSDIINRIIKMVLEDENDTLLKLNTAQKCAVIKHLSETESKMFQSHDFEVQIYSMVSGIVEQLAKSKTNKNKPA